MSYHAVRFKAHHHLFYHKFVFEPRKCSPEVRSGLQKVGTAGTGGTGKQSDLRGTNFHFLIFLNISDGKFEMYSYCGTGKQNIFCSPGGSSGV